MTEPDETAKPPRHERFAILGTASLGFGILLIIARALETARGIPGLPRSWYQNDWLWWLIGLTSVGVGARLLAQSESLGTSASWKPSHSGKRFQELVFYTRDGCPLCEEAAEVLQTFARWLPPVKVVNIDTEPDLVKRFGACVPVVELDGKIRFRGKIHPTLMRRLIEGTSPARLPR